MGKGQSKPYTNTSDDGNRKKEKSAQVTVNGIVDSSQPKNFANNDKGVATVFASTNSVEKKGTLTRDGITAAPKTSATEDTIAAKTTDSIADDSGKVTGDGTTETATPTPETTQKNTQALVSQDVGHSGNLSINDFELLKVLGKGSYGRVMLCKKKDENPPTLYAIKTLRKEALIKRGQLAHTSTERYILQNITNPFLTHLKFAFQTVDKLYMVLEYMPGGELFFWLKKDRKFTESRALLYTAEITAGLEALHSVNIVYRDLKPENILLDVDGHLRLTDFGLAKGNITGAGPEGGTKTFCGTPEYLAPELLENTGHGKAVDWWALGTLLHEMICGRPPYYDTNVQRMYHKILHEPLRFPKGENKQISEPAKELIRGLLMRKISERTGSGPSGAMELRNSKFLSTINWDMLLDKAYEPEFRPPAMRGETDVRNFDAEFTGERAVDSVVTTHLTGTMARKSDFENFTYNGSGNM